MQLVRGGSDRRLQNASLLEVMPLLAGAKLLSGAEIAQLTDAYRVLRKAENALQIIRDEQTHSIPRDPVDLARLCFNMGMPDCPGALARIESARGSVARQFAELLFGVPDAQRRGGETALGWLDAENVDIGGGTGRRWISGRRRGRGRAATGSLSPCGSLSQTR